MNKALENAYKTAKKIDKLETQKSELTEKIKNTPDAHCRKKAAFKQQKKEVSKALKEQKKNFTAIVIADGLPSEGAAQHVEHAMARVAKKASQGKAKVTGASGRHEDMRPMLGDSSKPKEIEE